MKILLINAGAKNYGATQEILTTLKNAFPAPIKTDILCLGDVKIGYCKGCKLCYDNCSCVQADDMEAVMAQIDAADKIIIAAPSYWADIPGQFKVFIDRCTLYSDTNPNPDRPVLKRGKKCYGIALRTGTRPTECLHIIDTIKHWCGHMNIDMADSMYFCQILDEKDIDPHKTEICKKAQE